jgi:hypothetical protein
MPEFTGEWRKLREFFVLIILRDIRFAGKPVNGLHSLYFDQKKGLIPDRSTPFKPTYQTLFTSAPSFLSPKPIFPVYLTALKQWLFHYRILSVPRILWKRSILPG